MTNDIFEGKWKQIRGKIREQWGKLTNDDVDKINGKSDRLVGLLQERYGYAKDKAEFEMNKLLEGFYKKS
jgi:uncharacterized protein YjbJ (UPF0337 family)